MKKGFTLIELMVVIVIMAALSTVAVPKIFNLIERSRRSLDASNALEISKILTQAYYDDTIIFPGEVDKNSTDPTMTVVVIVDKSGANLFRGNRSVLINSQDSTADGDDAYKRFKSVFENASFTDIVSYAKNSEDGGWDCYGAALYPSGKTKVFAATNAQGCAGASDDGGYATVLSAALNGDNPILNYIPNGSHIND